MKQYGVPLILRTYAGNEGYYLGHLVAAIMDAKDTGDWKAEILLALRDEAERRRLGPTFFTNDNRRFEFGDGYGWKETT